MASLGNVKPENFTAKFSVGDMTCTNCSNQVEAAIRGVAGVTNAKVDHLQGIAKVTMKSQRLVHEVVNAIVDAGHDAEIAPDGEENVFVEGQPRTISLQVGGMLRDECCPAKVMASIEKLGVQITVDKPLTSISDPIVTLSYIPATPTLSIRSIMNAMAEARYPNFNISVYHPPTPEELSQQMQKRDQRCLLYRLLFSVFLAIPAFIFGIVYGTLVKEDNHVRVYLSKPTWANNISLLEWILFAISTPMMFIACSNFHRKTYERIRFLWKSSSTPLLHRLTRFGSMDMLVSLGVSVAYFSSIAIMALSASSHSGTSGASMYYFDSVVFLGMFLLAGKYLQAYCKSRTTNAVNALMSLRPRDALLVTSSEQPTEKVVIDPDVDLEKGNNASWTSDWKTVKIPVDNLEINDIVEVPLGSSPPTDGFVVAGFEGYFDESSLTGESSPVQKIPGRRVFVGTINKGKPIQIRVSSIGKKSLLDEIIDSVRNAQAIRAPIERIADQITGYFVPGIILLALSTWLIWLSLGLCGMLPAHYLDMEAGWVLWSLQFAIATFVVACPCGIGLAAPTALFVGTGLAAKFGIIAHGGGESFQEMSQVDLVVFDKTGTLTEGSPYVTDSRIRSSVASPTILGIARRLESASTHPLAVAILNFCKDGIQHEGLNLEEKVGYGVQAEFPKLQCSAIIGSELWMKDNKVVIDSLFREDIDQWELGGNNVVLLAIQSTGSVVFTLVAAFAVMDSIRREAPEVIKRLHEKGIQTYLLSGDKSIAASYVAKSVGIPSSNVIANVRPHGKVEHIQSLQKKERTEKVHRSIWNWWDSSANAKTHRRTVVAMVGDGINDAPALEAADVGIAIGSGSDIAISSANFILQLSDLKSILTLLDLSRRIMRRIKFNFVWAILYNVLAVPIAAGVLYPVFHTRLSPVWASLAMALSSISVICSSLLLGTYKNRESKKTD